MEQLLYPLTIQERDTILAALFFYQQHGGIGCAFANELARNGGEPLPLDEIGALGDRLNGEGIEIEAGQANALDRSMRGKSTQSKYRAMWYLCRFLEDKLSDFERLIRAAPLQEHPRNPNDEGPCRCSTFEWVRERNSKLKKS